MVEVHKKYFYRDEKLKRIASLYTENTKFDNELASVIHILYLKVPKQMRKMGIATSLLAELCTDADSLQKLVWLELVPEKDTDVFRLIKLYEKFNFGFPYGITSYMIRHPVKKDC